MSLTKKLKQYFGFDSFREKQTRIVKGALKGYDQLVILPQDLVKVFVINFLLSYKAVLQ